MCTDTYYGIRAEYCTLVLHMRYHKVNFRRGLQIFIRFPFPWRMGGGRGSFLIPVTLGISHLGPLMLI